MNKKTIKILLVFTIIIIGVSSIIVYSNQSKKNKIAPNVNYGGDCGCKKTKTNNYGGCGCGK